MLLPRISTNVSVWPAEPDGDPLGPLPRLARRVRGAAAPTRWCCRRTGCRFAASPPASAQLRDAPRRAPRRGRRRRLPRGGRVRAPVAPPTSCRCCSGASSTCSSGFSRWARRSPTSITSGTRGRSTAASAAGRRVRFAPPLTAESRSATRHERTPCHAHPPRPPPPEAPAAPTYDPVALAESLASAAEKSAKLMGDFATRQAESGKSMRRRRARHRQGLHGARRRR